MNGLIWLATVLAIYWPTCASNLEVSTKSNVNSLVHVHIVWRHGDRTPSVLIPTDIQNTITTWPDGLGELTLKGLKQQYNLGKLIRSRYDGFLSRHYSPFEIYIRSSDYNRTLVSAQANLLGMYPPENSELFIKNIRWRPIPVHTMPKQQDKELFDRVPCPNADLEEEILYNSPVVRQLEEENRDILSYIGEKSGYTKKGEPVRLRNVWQIFDPLWAEYNHPEDHKLPAWINDTIRDQIFKLYHLSSSYLYGSPLLKRLRAGPLFKAVLNRMIDRSTVYLDPRERLYAYSAHDTAVAALLSGFGITPVIFPEYATAVFVELHKINNKFIVQLFYKNHTHSDVIYQLGIPHCLEPCELEKLRDVTSDLVPKNWEEECGLFHVDFFRPDIYALIFLSAFLILLFLCCLGIFTQYNNFGNKQFPKNYRLLEQDSED